jgi:hypothetical protein
MRVMHGEGLLLARKRLVTYSRLYRFGEIGSSLL